MYKLNIDNINNIYKINIINDNIAINNIENYIYNYIKKYNDIPDFLEIYEIVNKNINGLDFFNLYID